MSKLKQMVVLLMNSPPVDDEDHEYDKQIGLGVAALKDLMLELIGADEATERKGLIGLTHRDEARNELKAELRKRVSEL